MKTAARLAFAVLTLANVTGLIVLVASRPERPAVICNLDEALIEHDGTYEIARVTCSDGRRVTIVIHD